MFPDLQVTSIYLMTGNIIPRSFESSSHVAERMMSRAKARLIIDLENERKALSEKLILHAIRGRRDLDEAPSSYKDIDEVMGNQEDLVDIQIKLKPLAVIKG